MANLSSGIILNEGEQLIAEIEAELWATSANPIAQLVGSITKFINKILGNKKSGFIVITDKRVVEVVSITRCYVFNTAKEVKFLLPSSIKEVGFIKKATCGLFCPGYYFYYQGFTQTTEVLLKDTDEAGAQKLVDSFYRALKS
jgi:hypothetical protein